MMLKQKKFLEKINSELNNYEKDIYIQLLDIQIKEKINIDSFLNIQIKDLVKTTNLSRCTVMKYLKSLASKNFLIIDKDRNGPGNKNKYKLLVFCESYSDYIVSDSSEYGFQNSLFES